MTGFQQRAIDELAALQEKLAKLDAFLDTETYRNLPAVEKGRLGLQQYHMRGYAYVLAERIGAFAK